MIDQAPYLPRAEFRGDRVILHFKIMPEPDVLEIILEQARQAIATVNALAGTDYEVEYRLPVTATAAS